MAQGTTLIDYECSECDSIFRLSYETVQVETPPLHCPFCGCYFDEDNILKEDDIE